MEFEKKLTFVQHAEISKNGNTYHRLVFKDSNGEYIDSLVTSAEYLSKLVVEKDYTCIFNIYKKSKTYELKMYLKGVK